MPGTNQLIANALATQTEVLKALAAAQGVQLKTPASAADYTGIFEPGGIFSVAGTDRDVINAHVAPVGISERLPRFPGNEDNPRYATLTGVTDTTGARAVNPCDDNPSGYLKGCYLTARYGRVAFDTNTLELDKLRRRANRGVFDDLILHGRMLGMTNLAPSELSEDAMFNIVTKSEMVGVGVQFERALSVQDWTGSANVFTANNGYKEYPGLDVQITTGVVDAETNQACPALDSDVKDFNYNDVAGSNPSIVTYMSALEWYVRNNATRMRLMPATWVWAMRPELWEELSAVWPCQYNTNRCSNAMVGTGSRLIVDGGEMVAIRDQMREAMTIDVNGRRYDVVVDDGIFEHTNINNGNLGLGQYASTIYFVPLTITGGFPVTYKQFVDYRLAGDDIDLLRGLESFWTDTGIYSWAVETQKWCYKFSAKTEQRIVLRTPQLAGRIDRVRYEPLQHLRSPYPDSPYNMDGGVSVRGGTHTYASWLNDPNR